MGLADDMRAMIRGDVLPMFVPDEANFYRVRYSGGTENFLGETPDATRAELELYAIETTGLGNLDDSELRETVVGGQEQGEIFLMLLEPLLELGDRVERISNSEPWEVVEVVEPRLNDNVVSHNYRIRRQTD